MVYVQYYHEDGREACGDRAVVVLDGRNSLETMKKDAEEFNGYRRPIYSYFRIFRGESFTRSRPVTEVLPLKPRCCKNQEIDHRTLFCGISPEKRVKVCINCGHTEEV